MESLKNIDIIGITEFGKISSKEKSFIKSTKFFVSKKTFIKSIFAIFLILLLIYNKFFFKISIINNNNNYIKKGKTNIFNINRKINFEKYKLSNTTLKEIKNYTEFINLAKEGIILYKDNLIKSENPKISVIIALFNRDEFIKPLIKSIQNQNFKDLEIIIVDDHSKDNSIKYVEEAKKSDPRIILYKNKVNMGSLYTKSFGILNAKGEYLYLLDSDNMFGTEDYLETLYNIAKKTNCDIVECNAFYINLVNKYIVKRRPYWVVLWSKLIRTNLFKKIIYQLGTNILYRKIVALDDEFFGLYFYKQAYVIELNKTGVINFIHHDEHIFFNKYSSKKAAKKYCMRIINTINGFYDLNHIQGKRMARNLYYYLFVNGNCQNYVDKILFLNLQNKILSIKSTQIKNIAQKF